jgi:hypothetical protein
MPFYRPDLFKNPIKLNRPLDEAERDTQMKQGERQQDWDNSQPQYDLSVTRFNSTFVELVDINYPPRGIITFLNIASMGMTSLALFAIFYYTSIQEFLGFDGETTLAVLLAFALSSSLFVFSIYAFLRECFAYTHYPVRLNRVNGKVYVWRKQGVVSYAWKDLHFWKRKYRDAVLEHMDWRANALDKDGQTVIDSFPIGACDATSETEMRNHFEYFRRYMEEDPKEPYDMLKVCVPVALRKETWFEGYMRIALNMRAFGIIGHILMLWWDIPMSIARFIAMRTSKIPQWPEWVEQECKIDPQDPYVREAGYVYKADKKQ